jgi:hypothetical protein
MEQPKAARDIENRKARMEREEKLSAISYQPSAISRQLSAVSFVAVAAPNIKIAQKRWPIWPGFEGVRILNSISGKDLNLRP